MIDRLALFSPNAATRRDLSAAAIRAGLAVIELSSDPSTLLDAAGPGVAVRAPGGLVGAAMARGAMFTLTGPTADWFVGLGPEITGRPWRRVGISQARALIASVPALVKLADAKVPLFPARRYTTVAEFDAALTRLRPTAEIDLLATTQWLDIHSEYRAFTEHRDVLTCSPYVVEDEPWTPLLHTHRASFHHEAAAHAATMLSGLPEDAVPPAAALDIARLSTGDFVLLEANQSWSAGPYGCAPDAVLRAVLVANTDTAHDNWRWSPPTGLPDHDAT
jgi:hypothetical protein